VVELNQPISNAKPKGGARPGAGRPKGVHNIKPFRDYVSEEERLKFVEFILDHYMGDMRLAQWFGNQLFGQAPQSINGATAVPRSEVQLSHVRKWRNALRLLRPTNLRWASERMDSLIPFSQGASFGSQRINDQARQRRLT
jgi:hypothetical protein